VPPGTAFLARRPLVHLNQAPVDGSAHRGGPVVVTADGRIGIGTDHPTAALQVAGSIRSTLWELTKALPYQAGALPRAATVATHGGTWQLHVGASLYRAAADDPEELVAEVVVDGEVVSTLRGFSTKFGPDEQVGPPAGLSLASP
jgi:hypothetical protein